MNSKITKIILAVVAIALIVGFNMMMNDRAKVAQPAGDEHSEEAQKKIIDATLLFKNVVVVKTSKGDFEIAVLKKDIPNGAGTFLKLSKKGFYNNVRFDDVNSWMAKTELGQENIKPLELEQAVGLVSYRGAVALAAGDKSKKSTSSFFVIKETSPSVCEVFTIIGYVVKGMDVVDSLTEEDIINSTSIRKSTKEDETSLVKVFKDGKKDNEALQMFQMKAQMKQMQAGMPKAAPKKK